MRSKATKLGTSVLILLFSPLTFAGEYPLDCIYVARSAGADLEPHANCAAHEGTSLRIAPDHLKKMSFSNRGLAEVAVDGHWYYVKRDGRSLQVLTFDNGADPFTEGLTRSRVGGKIAYFDVNFHQVIAPIYDWGWPFDKGRARVCAGCRETEPDADGHRSGVGGKWTIIDKSGREISQAAKQPR